MAIVAMYTLYIHATAFPNYISLNHVTHTYIPNIIQNSHNTYGYML